MKAKLTSVNIAEIWSETGLLNLKANFLGSLIPPSPCVLCAAQEQGNWHRGGKVYCQRHIPIRWRIHWRIMKVIGIILGPILGALHDRICCADH